MNIKHIIKMSTLATFQQPGFARVSAHISDFPLTSTEWPKDVLGKPNQAEISGV